MARPEVTGKKYFTKRDVGMRYGGKHPRTIKRWVKADVFPKPDLVINNRELWADTTLDRHDRDCAIACAKDKRLPAPESIVDQEAAPADHKQSAFDQDQESVPDP